MSTKRKIFLGATIGAVVIGLIVFVMRDSLLQLAFQPTETEADIGTQLQQLAEDEPAILAQKLSVPWGVALLPDGEQLVTERPGKLRLIKSNQTIEVDGVIEVGEGGLLGVALHPEFEQNQLIYLYQTTRSNDESLINRVVRYRLDDTALIDPETIIDNIPGANYHDGGRIAFGPDDLLYITTGDAGEPDSAQDITSLAGKILRLNPDGSLPEDNPFSNEVYSYGHRNPQGLAWDSTGQLWSTEHGRSGLQSGFDELNEIEAGGNYGWPEIQGDESRDGMISPVLHSGAGETWAPASLAFANGSLYFGGLRGQTLYEVSDFDTDPQLTAHFREDYGRLRAVIADGDSLIFTTSNQDGRGDPITSDDRLIKIDVASLQN